MPADPGERPGDVVQHFSIDVRGNAELRHAVAAVRRRSCKIHGGIGGRSVLASAAAIALSSRRFALENPETALAEPLSAGKTNPSRPTVGTLLRIATAAAESGTSFATPFFTL